MRLNNPPRSGRDLYLREVMSDERDWLFGWGSKEAKFCGTDIEVEFSARKHVSVLVVERTVKIYFFLFISRST